MPKWDRKAKTFNESPEQEWLRRPKRPDIKCKSIFFTTQPEGDLCEFNIYEEKDLPFLDRRTEMGREVAQKVIQSSLDDDVMSDDDTIRCANAILNKELNKAISSYQSAFNKASLIRNLE
jgi:hypothetical protein